MKDRRITLFTIASKNYLAYVRVLLKSVAAHHPEYRLCLCLADEAAPQFDPSREPYDVVQADALGIPGFDDMVLRYDIMELNTAVKPSMIRWLFDTTDADAVIYLDPDIQLFSRLAAVEEHFASGASVVLTPHITRPLEDGRTPNDHHMLQAGVFNLGFIGVRRCDDSLAFIDWWARRLATQAVSDVHNNLFTDQRWCDLAPCFVDRLAVLKDPGYNVAYWNLAQRHVLPGPRGAWSVDGRPLAFFHFSGVNIGRRDIVSKHQDRLTWNSVPQVRSLFDGYFDALQEEGIDTSRHWLYRYGRLNDLLLVPALRQLYRQWHPQARSARTPFTANELVSFANDTEPGMPPFEPARVTRLMHLIHCMRPDLQAAFSLGTAQGRTQFCRWFEATAKNEYGLPQDLIPPAPSDATLPVTPSKLPPVAYSSGWRASESEQGHQEHASESRARLARVWHALPQRTRSYVAPALLSVLPELLAHAGPKVVGGGKDGSSGIKGAGLFTQMLDPASIDQFLQHGQINILMYLIWKTRPDLQVAFDLSTKMGQQQYIDWYAVAAAEEYGPHVADARDVRPLGHSHRMGDLAGEPGVNIVGYARAETGLGEHLRKSAAALHCTAVPFGVINVRHSSGREEAVLEHGAYINAPVHRANLIHVNADQMLQLYGQHGQSLFGERFNIGYWAWELARWPDAWTPVIDLVHEVWAPSTFIRDAIAAVSRVPVLHMPQCVSLPPIDPRLDRRHFRLDEDAYHFLFAFDYQSYVERKNPAAVVRAFSQAFPRGTEKVRLVLKVMNVDPAAPGWQTLAASMAEDSRIVVISRTMDHRDVLALCAACDAFVSLHRAEGFGRGPAEAMYLGRPVIVTAYSGNTDFTRSDTACLVDYQLVPVPFGAYPMHEGQVWAEADVEHAAWHMRRLAADGALGSKIGLAGQAYVHEHFGEHEVGGLYARRLRELGMLR